MNPYEVLGVSENADEETIKRAYKELVKKYHPDKYVNNPLADLASEKLKEINKAYDMIMSGNTSNTSGYSGSGYNQGGNTTNGTASFQTVRMLINTRNIMAAESMLQGLPRNAEWNYLMGLCYMQKGWYDAGLNYIRTASNMDPSNLEYRATLNNFQNRNQAYRGYNGGMVGTNADCCTQLCIADMCCECMGGDLVPCC